MMDASHFEPFTIKSKISERKFISICIQLAWTPIYIILYLLASGFFFYLASKAFSRATVESSDFYWYLGTGIAIFVGRPLLSIIKIQRKYRHDPYFKSDMCYTFHADKVIVNYSGGANRSITWDEIASVREVRGYILITMAKGTYYIDKSQLSRPEKNFIFSKVEPYKAVNSFRPKPENKALYLIGLAGIIPFIGALIGVILLIAGIFKYRDKLLIVIGLGGILVSGAFYGAMAYCSGGNKSSIQAMTEVSQNQLDSLAKRIELFKAQNGYYPDSLGEIGSDVRFIDIQDPFLIRKGNGRDLYFNYRRVGNRYTLFSVGKDGIPNTADDIFPDGHLP